LEAENYTLENIKTIASEGRANHILLGRLTKAGDTFRLDYELQNTLTGELVGTDSVKGNGEAELPNMVDEVTRLIKANLNLTLAQIEDDIDEEVATITTSSPEAYKYYVEASRLYRMGEHSKAIELYEKAVAFDPDFALAYRDLAGASTGLRLLGKWREYNQKAYDLRDNVSLRERLRIEGDFLRSKRKMDEAEKVYKELLELYPDDWIGNNSYALIYLRREDWEKAAEIFEINVNNKVEAVHSYVNVAKAYEAMGAYQKAEEVIAYCLNNVSSSDSTRTYLVYAYLFHYPK
jgi:tetratricopeptide (TPR) repeat protein